MFLLQAPPPTRFDLRFSVAGFPIRVHPLFWLIAILFGSSAGSPAKVLAWIIAIFVSITIHELGHAFALRRNGVESEIILHAAGGLTVPESVSWGGRSANVAISPNQQIFISLAGPFTGFLFAALLLVVSAALGGVIIPNFIFGFVPFPYVLFPAGWEILTSFYDEPALGEHLLGTRQSYARPPVGRRQHYQIHFDPNRSVEWITHVALGFGHHGRSSCHCKFYITKQHLHGDLIWHVGVSKFSIIAKRRRKILKNLIIFKH